MGLSRALTCIAIVAVFTGANGDVGGVCGEDGTVALAALETHLEATKTSGSSGVRECARAFFARACEHRGVARFGSNHPASSHDSEATRACFAPVCEMCSLGRLSFVAPRGGYWEKDPATETAEASARSARRAACSVCESNLKSYDVSETARIAPIDVWTTGWYASWLAFLAVDAIVAASLGYWGQGHAYYDGVGFVHNPFPNDSSSDGAASHPVLPPVIVDDVAVDPYWSPSVVVPPVTTAQEYQEHTPNVPYVHPPPPTWSWPPPPPPEADEHVACSADALAAALPAFAPSLVPCLAGVSATCCTAVASAVGPDSSAALPNCLCSPDAFEALAAVMAGIEVDLDALLEGCASTSGAPAIAFVHGAGGTCDGIAKRVPGPRAEVEVAVRGAARTGHRRKAFARSNVRKT
jgi:hypothetical protein